MSEVSYFICHERETIDAIFNNLRGNRKVRYMYITLSLRYLLIMCVLLLTVSTQVWLL